MSHNRIRTFNKYVANRITRRFAYSSRGPFAIIRHVGRKSGRSYEATIIVEPVGERFVIALTYGPEVDWYRNVLAAGRATLLWHGNVYTLEKPEPMDAQVALLAFPQPFRSTLRVLGTKQFVGVKYHEIVPEVETARA